MVANKLNVVIASLAAVIGFASGQSAYDMAVVNGQLPAICDKIVQFNQCNMDANNAMAGCSADLSGVPDIKYYQCLCEGQQKALQCYSLCPQDLALQGQRLALTDSATNSCNYVKDNPQLLQQAEDDAKAKEEEKKNPPSSKSGNRNNNSNSTKTEDNLPPLPSSSNRPPPTTFITNDADSIFGSFALINAFMSVAIAVIIRNL
ncbi:hypothetical protein MP228_006559 [Amoeboaphelidium protococcarum]|nr:hypothetical protein MP228_006559 [Amoeboaphelidium protococcarum]